MRVGVILVCMSLVAMFFQPPIGFFSNSDGPTFPLEVSTDKYYYTVGEPIVISLTNVGDEDVVFRHDPPDLYIVDSALRIVVDNHFCAKWFCEVRIPPESNHTMNWDQKYRICDINGPPIPPSGLQVDPGKYLISAGMDNSSYGNQTMSIWDSVWIEIGSGNSPPVANAGSDQTVYVDDVVQFDGSASHDPDAVWQIETVDSDGDVGHQSSLALDGNDYPHISYHELFLNNSTGGSLKYARWNGSEWNIEQVTTVTIYGRETALALDANEYPHIVFGELVNIGNADLKYARWTGDNWSIETIDTVGSTSKISMALDSNDTPHISYFDNYNRHLKYATLTEGNWSIEIVEYLNNIRRPGTSIAIDSNDRPCIGYHSDHDLKYARWTGSSWVREMVDSFGDVGGWTSMALDSKDRAHFSYLNSTVSDGKGTSDLKYARWTGSKWETETIDYAGTVGYFTSIAIDDHDIPHISYHDHTNSDLKYATLTGGKWTNETVDSAGYVGYWTSIAIDSNNLPHISYGAEDPIFDLKYAKLGDRIIPFEWDFDDGAPLGQGIETSHSYDSPGIYSVYLTVEDAHGANDTDNCTITVLQNGQPPVADAGPDQTVNEGDTVQFDGTGSTGGGGGIGEWVWKAFVPSFRMGGGSATLDDDIYFLGGVGSRDGMGQLAVKDTAEVYSATNDTWYGHFHMPEPRSGLGAAAVEGKVYAIGGNNGTDSTDTTFEYDPSTGSWTEKAVMPMALEGFGIATVNDKIYIMGGYSTLIDCYPCGNTYEYDPSADSWSQKADLPTGRNALAAVALNGRIYAIGGDANGVMDEVEVYDPASDKWTTATDMIEPRSHIRAEALGGDIYVMGGYGGLVAPRTVDIYDASQDNWTVLQAQLVEPRIGPGSGVVGSCVNLFGGSSGHMAGLLSLNEQYCLDGELEYEWDFDATEDLDGDGGYINDKEATGPTPTHTYYDDGLYVVTLTVTDSQDLQDTDQCNITVLNVAPIPEWTSRSADGTILAPPYPEGKEILFEATVSDPGIYDTFTHDWDFGDGAVLLDAGPNVVHVYGDDRTYTVVLTVTDDDGGVGVDDTPPLPTTNEDPVPKIDLPFCIFVEGLDPCDAIGMFTDPGWLDTHSAVWDFGDGTTETAVLIEKHDPPASTGWNLSSHLYGDNGLYTITFTVSDDDGGKGTATAKVPVQNHPPSFDLYVPITVNEGEQFVLGVEATDPGSDDLAISVDWGDGTSDSRIYYNDGVGPDPPISGAGVFPFVVQADFTHVYPDDGDYDVTVEVEDDDGGSDVKAFQIPVLNVAPTVTLEVLPIEVNASLRIAGEKWHDVAIELYEDDVLITSGTLVRYPGSPDDQRLDLTHLQVDYSKKYSAIVRYTPEDDPINGQPNGANPCWIILTFSDGQELWVHHTFNVQHPETYVWEVDLTTEILLHGMMFEATAFDPGADELTFHWDFGDGTNATSFYLNGNGTYPVTIMEIINHVFPGSGTYTVVLTVEDDDGGVGTASVTIVIP
jgi:PKD repeat protein